VRRCPSRFRAVPGVVAVVALLAGSTQILIGVVFRRVVQVHNGENNLRAGDWMQLAVAGPTPLAAMVCPREDAPTDLLPVARVALAVLRLDRHYLLA